MEFAGHWKETNGAIVGAMKLRCLHIRHCVEEQKEIEIKMVYCMPNITQVTYAICTGVLMRRL